MVPELGYKKAILTASIHNPVLPIYAPGPISAQRMFKGLGLANARIRGSYEINLCWSATRHVPQHCCTPCCMVCPVRESATRRLVGSGGHSVRAALRSTPHAKPPCPVKIRNKLCDSLRLERSGREIQHRLRTPSHMERILDHRRTLATSCSNVCAELS